MRCFQLQSSLLLPLHAKLKHQLHHISHTSKLFCLSTHQPPCFLHLSSSTPLSTKALPHLMVVAPAESGDLSSLLPISGVLLSMYFVANFVVPGFLANSISKDESNEKQKVDEDDEDEEGEEEDEDEDEEEEDEDEDEEEDE
ncbi:nucleolin [Vigna radiata var. radiata]|uniref:Nucleolin n=1 Tax=Vigna radiata var. radiata TaxID=3916 RepID=A0A1S3UDS0_VIGRR|nr:nucleolin [Vigna radiata var. radiata]